MKEYLTNWVKFGFFVLLLVIIGLLFRHGHSILAVIILTLSILVIHEIDIRNLGEGIFAELQWIQDSIVNKDQFQTKTVPAFYAFMLNNLKQGKIKNGMTLEEIYKTLEKQDGFEDNFVLCHTYFGEDKTKTTQNDVFVFHGWGLEIPCPKLVLTIKNGKLTRWKQGI